MVRRFRAWHHGRRRSGILRCAQDDKRAREPMYARRRRLSALRGRVLEIYSDGEAFKSEEIMREAEAPAGRGTTNGDDFDEERIVDLGLGAGLIGRRAEEHAVDDVGEDVSLGHRAKHLVAWSEHRLEREIVGELVPATLQGCFQLPGGVPPL